MCANNTWRILTIYNYNLEIIEKQTEVVIGLHQEDNRGTEAKLTRPYLDIGKFKYFRSDNS